MKKLLKILLVLCCVSTAVVNRIEPTKADEVKGSVSLSVSASTVTLGSNIKVTISISCDGGGMAQIKINYNTAYVTLTSYPSGDFNPSSNTLILDSNGNKTASCTFTFKTKAIGSTTFTANVVSFQSYKYSSVTGYSSSLSRTVTIKQQEILPSADNTISKLEIEGYQLEPAFSSDVTSYKIYLPKDTSKLNITAVASNSKSKIGTIDGNVKPGWNEIQIVCTAENKATRTYTIQAYVEEEPTLFYSVGEQKLGVVKNLDKVVAIEGYEPEDLVVGEDNLTVYSNGVFDLLYVENEEGIKDFYIYDRKTNSLGGIYNPLTLGGHTFLETTFNSEDFNDLNENFHLDDIALEERTLKGWSYNDENLSEFKLLYLINEKGETGLYRYDIKEDTIQRYAEPAEQTQEVDLLPYIFMSTAIAGIFTLFWAIIVIAKKDRKARN